MKSIKESDRKLWNALVKRIKESLQVSVSGSTRQILQSRRALASRCLQEIIGGDCRRGTYCGRIIRDDPFFVISLNPDWTCNHFWLEKDGLIYDPTWWSIDDKRYKRSNEQA